MTLLSVSVTNAPVLYWLTLWIMNLELVPGEGLEPSHCLQHRILSPARLPIPPSRQVKLEIIHETEAFIKYKRCPMGFDSKRGT